MSENKFSQAMKKLADVQLMEMINDDPSGYDPLALIAAKEELKSRNLTFEEKEAAETRVLEREQIKNESLTSSERTWFILTSWYPGSWTKTAQLMADGYETKSSEARALMKKYVLFVFLALVLLVIVLSQL